MPFQGRMLFKDSKIFDHGHKNDWTIELMQAKCGLQSYPTPAQNLRNHNNMLEADKLKGEKKCYGSAWIWRKWRMFVHGIYF